MLYFAQNQYKMANKAVAELCNHKKTVSKNHGQAMANAQNRVNVHKMKVKVLEKELVLKKKMLAIKLGKLKPKLEVKTDGEHKVKTEPELTVKTEPELKVKAELEVKSEEDDQVNSKVSLERVDIKKEPKVEVKEEISNNTAEEEEEVVKVTKHLKKTNKKGLMERVENCKNRLKDALVALEKAESDAGLKEEMKEIALGTSKLNYLDPRITVQWSKTHEVPLEKVTVDVKGYTVKLQPLNQSLIENQNVSLWCLRCIAIFFFFSCSTRLRG